MELTANVVLNARVLDLLVVLHVLLRPEHLVAPLALEEVVVVMHQHVSPEILRLPELPIANRAFVNRTDSLDFAAKEKFVDFRLIKTNFEAHL